MSAELASQTACVSHGVQRDGPVRENKLVLLSWFFLSFLAVALIPGHIRFGSPMWHLPQSPFIEVLAASIAFLCQAFVFSLTSKQRKWRAYAVIVVANAVCFGAAFVLLMLRMGSEESRLFFIMATLMSVALSALPLFVGKYIRWIALLLALILTAELASGAQELKSSTSTVVPVKQTISTTLHRLTISHYQVLQDPTRARISGGAIVAVEDGFLLVTGEGDLYQLSWTPNGLLHSVRLPFSVPLQASVEAAHFSAAALRIRATGMTLQANGPSMRLFVVHDYWNMQKKCFTTRVSTITVAFNAENLLTNRSDWETIFEAQPCLELSPGLDQLQSGGRIAFMPDGKLLLTLGDHGINGLNRPALAQSPTADYGKLLVLDLEGHHSTFSIGHRNPQGLYIESASRIWETEHGPQGGDELNLIKSGGNYGWPLVTYGADYGYDVWPLMSAETKDHGSFVEPVHAFLPSIGVSNLIELNGKLFNRWGTDLVIGSLRAETLFRAHVRDERVVYMEPIPVGRRVRDLVQGKDGRILLWTDAGDITVLDLDLAPNVYARCSGCHEASAGIRALGPSLRNVVKRPIGSEFEYDYSPALANIDDVWTESNLDEFLRSPDSFASGTKMKFAGIPDDKERAEIIRFLKQYTIQ